MTETQMIDILIHHYKMEIAEKNKARGECYSREEALSNEIAQLEDGLAGFVKEREIFSKKSERKNKKGKK